MHSMNDEIDNMGNTLSRIINDELDPYELDMEIHATACELIQNWGSLWDQCELENHFLIMYRNGERERFASIYEAVWTSMLIDNEWEDRYIKAFGS